MIERANPSAQKSGKRDIGNLTTKTRRTRRSAGKWKLLTERYLAEWYFEAQRL